MKPTLDDFSYSCQKIGFISFDLVFEKPPVEIGQYQDQDPDKGSKMADDWRNLADLMRYCQISSFNASDTGVKTCIKLFGINRFKL